MTASEFKELETHRNNLPDITIDLIEVMANTHASIISNFNVFVAANRIMTDLVRNGLRVKREGLYEIIRRHHEFINVGIITFAYGEDEFSNSEEGHWLIFAIDTNEDRVYCFCSYNSFKGAQKAFENTLSCFVEPYLSYKIEHSEPIDIVKRG